MPGPARVDVPASGAYRLVAHLKNMNELLRKFARRTVLRIPRLRDVVIERVVRALELGPVQR